MLTWSLGWTGFAAWKRSPPSISMARFEITSLTFMLLDVPDPVEPRATPGPEPARPPSNPAQSETLTCRTCIVVENCDRAGMIAIGQGVSTHGRPDPGGTKKARLLGEKPGLKSHRRNLTAS